jgi:hypothetical protein
VQCALDGTQAAFSLHSLCSQSRYLREVKRIRDEDVSRFSKVRVQTLISSRSTPVVNTCFLPPAQCTVLGRRYVLQFMLGRGGFSEVYKARTRC